MAKRITHKRNPDAISPKNASYEQPKYVKSTHTTMLKIHLKIDNKNKETIFAKVIDWPCMLRQDEYIFYKGKYYQIGMIYHDILNNIIHAYALPL